MVKKKVSLTIEKGILRKVDELVDKVGISSRSEAVEILLRRALLKKVVILCGGKKFYVEGTKIPRPLARLNKKRMIERTIEQLSLFGFKEVCIVGKAEVIFQVSQVIGKEIFGSKVTYVEEKESKGSARSLELAKHLLTSTFLLIPGDNVFNFDLEALWNFHLARNFLCTMALSTLGKPGELSTIGKPGIRIVKLKGDRVTSYTEQKIKPGVLPDGLIATMICACEPKIFSYISQRTNSLERDIFPRLVREGKLGGFIMDGWRINVHKKEDLKLAKSLL
jgi:NDP-sugar pyrophosphorylase family protein